MTKKHFIRAAEIVRTSPFTRQWKQDMASAFIDLFRGYNDHFDTDRFLVACGLQEKD